MYGTHGNTDHGGKKYSKSQRNAKMGHNLSAYIVDNKSEEDWFLYTRLKYSNNRSVGMHRQAGS